MIRYDDKTKTKQQTNLTVKLEEIKEIGKKEDLKDTKTDSSNTI